VRDQHSIWAAVPTHHELTLLAVVLSDEETEHTIAQHTALDRGFLVFAALRTGANTQEKDI